MCPEDGYCLNIERLGPELSRHGDGSTSLRNLLAAYEKSGLGGYARQDSIQGFLAERPLQKSGGDYPRAARTTFGLDNSIARQARLKTPMELISNLTEAGYGELLESLDLDFSGLED